MQHDMMDASGMAARLTPIVERPTGAGTVEAAAEGVVEQPVSDLATAVSQALAARGAGRFADVCVVVRDGVAHLRGSVHTYHAKQLAHAAVRSVAGVNSVHDELVVNEQPRRWSH